MQPGVLSVVWTIITVHSPELMVVPGINMWQAPLPTSERSIQPTMFGLMYVPFKCVKIKKKTAVSLSMMQ